MQHTLTSPAPLPRPLAARRFRQRLRHPVRRAGRGVLQRDPAGEQKAVVVVVRLVAGEQQPHTSVSDKNICELRGSKEGGSWENQRGFPFSAMLDVKGNREVMVLRCIEVAYHFHCLWCCLRMVFVDGFPSEEGMWRKRQGTSLLEGSREDSST